MSNRNSDPTDIFKKTPPSPKSSKSSLTSSGKNSPPHNFVSRFTPKMAEAGTKIRSIVGNFKDNAKYRISFRLKNKDQLQTKSALLFDDSIQSNMLSPPTYNEVLLGQIQKRYDEEISNSQKGSENQIFPPKNLFSMFCSNQPEDRYSQARLSEEDNFAAYLSAVQSCWCLVRAGLSNDDTEVLIESLRKAFNIDMQLHDSCMEEIADRAEFLDYIECKVLGAGYLSEHVRKDNVYCRVGVTEIDPNSINLKTHITSVIPKSYWQSTSAIQILENSAWNETLMLPLPQSENVYFFIEAWSASDNNNNNNNSNSNNNTLQRINSSPSKLSNRSLNRLEGVSSNSNTLQREVDGASNTGYLLQTELNRRLAPSPDLALPVTSCLPIISSCFPFLGRTRRSVNRGTAININNSTNGTIGSANSSNKEMFIGRYYMDVEKMTKTTSFESPERFLIMSRSKKHMRGTLTTSLRFVSRCFVPSPEGISRGPGYIPQLANCLLILPESVDPVELHSNILLALAKHEMACCEDEWSGEFSAYFEVLLKQHVFDHNLLEVQQAVAEHNVLSKVVPSLYCRPEQLKSQFSQLLCLFDDPGSGLGSAEKKCFKKTLEGLVDYHLHTIALNMFYIVHTDQAMSQKLNGEVNTLLDVIYELMQRLDVYQYHTLTKLRLEQKVNQLVAECFGMCLQDTNVTSFKFINFVESIFEYLKGINCYVPIYDIERDSLKHIHKCIRMLLEECIKKFMDGEYIANATELEAIRNKVYSLYTVVKCIQEVQLLYCSEAGTDNNAMLLVPFTSYIIPWFGDIAHKSCENIRSIIDSDKLSYTDKELYTTMVPDIEAVIYEALTFIGDFSWANNEALFKLVERFLNHLHRIVDIYVIQSREKLSQQTMDTTYLYCEEILILNNNSRMHDILDSAKDKLLQLVPAELNKEIVDNFSSLHERLDGYTEFLLDRDSKLFGTEVKEYLKNILKQSKDASIFEPFDSLMNFLKKVIQEIQDRSCSYIFKLILKMLWAAILDSIIKIIDKKPLKTSKKQERLDNIIGIMFDFFKADGYGLEPEELKTENYEKLVVKTLK